MPVYSGGLELGGKLSSGDLVGHGDDARAPADALREGSLDVAASGKRSHGKALRIAFDDGEGARTDGAGGAKNRDLLDWAFH